MMMLRRAKGLVAPLRQTEKRFLPKCQFAHGVTNLTLITAKEWSGVAFTLVLLCVSKKGAKLFQGHLLDARQKDTSIHPPVAATRLTPKKACAEYIDLLERLLIFYSWYQHGELWAHDDPVAEGDAHRRICSLMIMVQNLMPRDVGNSWNLPKMHEFFHFTRDTRLNGRVTTANASTGERLLQPMAKHVARTAQKRGEQEFVKQCARNMQISQCLDKAFRLLPIDRFRDVQAKKKKMGRESHDATHDRLCRESDRVIDHINPYFSIDFKNPRLESSPLCELIYHRKNQKDGCGVLPKSIQLYLAHVFQGNDWSDLIFGGHPLSEGREPPAAVYGYTEVVVGERRYRSHPFYRSKSAWCDWAVVNYEGHGDYPCRLCAFITDTKPMQDGILPPGAHSYAIVQTCNKVTNSETLLTKAYELEANTRREARFRLVELSSLKERVFVFEEHLGLPMNEEGLAIYPKDAPRTVHMVEKSQREWAVLWWGLEWPTGGQTALLSNPVDEHSSSDEEETSPDLVCVDPKENTYINTTI